MSDYAEATLGPSKTLAVDIGDDRLFYLELEGIREYWHICSAPNSVSVLVSSPYDWDLVVKVKWSHCSHLAYSGGYDGMAECSTLPFVPRIYWQHVYQEGAVYIGVSVRQFIHGTPLSDVWHLLYREAKMVLVQDTQMAIRTISSHTSGRFLEPQGINLATSNSVKYLNYLVLLSKLSRGTVHGSVSLYSGPGAREPVASARNRVRR